LALTGLATVHAQAQRQLVMYCGVDEKWCRAVATAYQKETGVQVDMTRMSAGEVYARVRAEKDNPHGDVWFGSLIVGAKHMDEAKKFYNWALTPEAQRIAAATGSFQIPSNPVTPVPPEAPDLSKIKLIEYDFAKYGSSETRKRLLGKWTNEVKNAPK
jgi:ABC-type Fe3+ transport system substrate-binding protein